MKIFHTANALFSFITASFSSTAKDIMTLDRQFSFFPFIFLLFFFFLFHVGQLLSLMYTVVMLVFYLSLYFVLGGGGIDSKQALK